MATREPSRQEEDDVDSFFLPGGIFDFLNHDTADSLLSSIGLDNRTSHESRVLSMTAAEHDVVQNQLELDLPDARTLSSAGTNPNAKEFLPFPVNYDEYSPGSHQLELSPPLQGYHPTEPHIPWETAPMTGTAFAFESPDLIHTDELNAIASFGPHRGFESSNRHPQTHTFDLAPVQRTVTTAQFEYDMSTSPVWPITTSKPVLSSASVEKQQDQLSAMRQADDAPFRRSSGENRTTPYLAVKHVKHADPPSTAQTQAQAQAQTQPLTQPHHAMPKQHKDVKERVKPPKPRKPVAKEPQRKDQSMSFLAVSSNQVRREQHAPKAAPSPAAGPATASTRTGAATAAVKSNVPPNASSNQPQQPPNSIVNRPHSLKMDGVMTPEKKEPPQRPRAATDEPPQPTQSLLHSSNQDLRKLSVTGIDERVSVESGGAQNGEASLESEWETIEKASVSSSASNSEKDKELEMDAPPPTSPVRRASDPPRPVGMETQPAANGSTPRSENGSSSTAKNTQLHQDKLDGAHQAGKDTGAKASKKAAKDAASAKHKSKNKQLSPQQPQQQVPKPSQQDLVSTARQPTPLVSRTKSAYQYLIPLKRMVIDICQKTFSLHSKTAVISMVASCLSEALTLVICLLAFVLAGLLSIVMLMLQLHEFALSKVLSDYHVAFCFAFPYSFSIVVTYVAQWAPHWAPVCLWYSFLVQLFCTSQENGHTSGYASLFRVLIPLLFIAEGVTSESYLMYLDGSELLLLSYLLSALKLECLFSPMFLITWALQVIAVALVGPRPLLQYFQLMLSLTSLHIISLHTAPKNTLTMQRTYNVEEHKPDDATQSA